MQQSSGNAGRDASRSGIGEQVFAVAGSLWFAGLLLMLVLVGMACATLFESAHGTEQALSTFYGSWWFKALFWLLGVNIFASMALRYPFTRKHLGFVLTHGGLLLIMAGAVVTMKWGVDGQLSVFEGETAGEIQVRQDMLTLLDRRDQSRAQFELTDGAFGGFASADFADAPSFDKNGLRVEVVRYLPDSAATERIVDDNPRFQPAVAISLSQASPEAMWIFGDEPAALGPVTAALRVARDAAEMQRFLQDEQNADSSSVGKITVTYQGTAREIAVEDCTAQAIKLDGADLSVRVLRYMPHATVGGENGIVNASNEPVNPAVEVELIGAAGTEKRVCFANFPDFQSMHGQEAAPDVKVVFHASQGAKPAAPLEIIVGPERTTFARFNQPGLPSQTQALAVGQPVATPWGGQTLTLHQRFDHARVDRPLEAVEPVRATRIPAVLLRLTSGQNSSEMWVQRGIPRQVSVDGAPYQILYGDRSVPLGFSVTLNDFKIAHYPGGGMPRSFESNITVTNPATGDTGDRIISMNHPVKYGGFTFYQSSYREGRGAAMSVLSVSRDPGRQVVFAGYILTTLGMIIVLNNRLRERRLMAKHATAGGAA